MSPPSASPIHLAFTVRGMSCTSCAQAIEKKLSTLQHARNANVNFAALRAEVDFCFTKNGDDTPSVPTPQQLRDFHASVCDTIKSVGYRADPLQVTRKRFIVSGMTCAGCASSLEKALIEGGGGGALLGILDASVAFASVSADVLFLNTVITQEAIEKAIEGRGYKVLKGSSSAAPPQPPHANRDGVTMDQGEGGGFEERGGLLTETTETEQLVGALERRDEITFYRGRFFGSLLFSAPLMVAMIIFMTEPFMKFEHENITTINSIYMAFATPVVLYFGRDYFIHAYQNFKLRTFTMDTLVAVGVGGAYVFSILALILQFQGIHATCYFDTAAELVTFMLLGKLLEAAAKAKTSNALVLLLKLTPPTASVIRTQEDGSETVVTVPSASVVQGDRVRVAAGDKIPVDGKVSEGTSEVDEAAVTGESLPRQVTVGSRVVGGTVNVVSVITVTATAVGSDTVVAQIIRIVEEAQRTKPSIQRFADRIAGVFVPVVLLVSASVFIVWVALGLFSDFPEEWRDGESIYVFAFQNFLSTLVVACPCALGLATPTAIMVGTGVGAEMGVLSKSGIVLETAPLIETFIFDKTGTLTTGKLAVTSHIYFTPSGTVSVNSGGDCSHEDLSIVSAVESMATHPIAVAITKFMAPSLALSSANAALSTNASSRPSSLLTPFQSPTTSSSGNATALPTAAAAISSADVVNHTVIGGKGISATVRGQPVRVGTVPFVREMVPTLPAGSFDVLSAMRDQGRTIVAAAVGNRIVAFFGLADRPKPEAKEVVSYLHSHGKRVMMVTGDNEAAALRIAKEVGIPPSDVVASCMPSDKERIVSLEQKGRGGERDDEGPRATTRVAFVGDGINDSPALAQADIGIALGAGTDIAIECADAVLMHDSLADILVFVDLAATVVRRIRLNFAWAIMYNIVMLPVAAGVLYPVIGKGLPPVVAGIAMIMSSLSVLASSLALRCYSRPSIASSSPSPSDLDASGASIVMDESSSASEKAALTRAISIGSSSLPVC